MSDEKPTPPEKPSAKTSSVPLKKETVRITLRKDAAGSAPPPAPGAPPAPKPPAAPAPPLGAKTVPLTPAPPAAAPAQVTAKLTPAGGPAQLGGTQPLPKATVKLQPAQAPGTSGAGVAPITTGKLSGELDDDSAEAGITPFASIALVMALAVFAIGFFTSQNIFEQGKKPPGNLHTLCLTVTTSTATTKEWCAQPAKSNGTLILTRRSFQKSKNTHPGKNSSFSQLQTRTLKPLP